MDEKRNQKALKLFQRAMTLMIWSDGHDDGRTKQALLDFREAVDLEQAEDWREPYQYWANEAEAILLAHKQSRRDTAIIVSNDFHNRVVRICPPDLQLSGNEQGDCRQQLCGVYGCHCFGRLGERGPHPIVDDEGNDYRITLTQDVFCRQYVQLEQLEKETGCSNRGKEG